MARAARKPNFLFTEDDVVPEVLTKGPASDDTVPPELMAAVGYAPEAAGKPKPTPTGPQDPEPEEPSDPPAPPPAPPTPPPPMPQASAGDPEETSPPVREPPRTPGEPPENPEDEDEPDEDEDEDDSGVPTSPGDDEDDEEDDPKALAPAMQAPAASAPPHPGGVHYEARITIVDAWQYPGSLKAAPAWVDRNWAAYLDYDALRNIEPGPGLRVPLPSGITAVVRIGDYLARQEVKLTRDVAEVRLEVWEQTQFEKIFLPTSTPLMSNPQSMSNPGPIPLTAAA